MIRSTVPHVMVIDDDQAVLSMVCDALLHHGMAVHPFSEGRKAMSLLENPKGPQVDLVISDINMDGMDGFDVIHKVKSIHPSLPVVLMTGQASLEYAIRAMRMGAANLFQKPLTLRELIDSVFHLVGLHREIRLAEAGLKGLARETRCFMFRSDELDIPSTVMHLTDRLVPMGFATPTNVDVIAMAYHEALVNALEHGNLEVDSALKRDLFSAKDAYSNLVLERRMDPEYASRPIEVLMEATPLRYEVVITDGGKGFNTRKVSRISDETLTRQCGRGLAMIRMVMDEVDHNPKGNQIRMVLLKKRAK
jgi:FixJ family two-component response regulator/anti-sigma regulatory factor (Ser/Thr protein kinase)